MSAADSDDMPRVLLRLRAVEALLREVITDLTCKTEAVGDLQFQVKALETWRDARSAMDDHVLTHLRECHDPRDTSNIFDCWVCLPYMIPDEVRAVLSPDDTQEF